MKLEPAQLQAYRERRRAFWHPSAMMRQDEFNAELKWVGIVAPLLDHIKALEAELEEMECDLENARAELAGEPHPNPKESYYQKAKRLLDEAVKEAVAMRLEVGGDRAGDE